MSITSTSARSLRGIETMKDERSEWFVDGCILGIIAVFYAWLLLSNVGCATTACPPCVPEVETITINVPVDACEPPEALPTLTYPQWPEVPQTASEDDWKAFYANVVATLAAREKILQSRVSALEEMLDYYR